MIGTQNAEITVSVAANPESSVTESVTTGGGCPTEISVPSTLELTADDNTLSGQFYGVIHMRRTAGEEPKLYLTAEPKLEEFTSFPGSVAGSVALVTTSLGDGSMTAGSITVPQAPEPDEGKGTPTTRSTVVATW